MMWRRWIIRLSGLPKKGDYKKEYAEYPPVEIWLRRKGTGLDDYSSTEPFRFDAGRRVQFTPEPGYEDKWDLTQNKASHVTHLNQLDLEKAFGNNIVGLRLKQDSPYYRTSFDAAFTLQIYPPAGNAKCHCHYYGSN